MQARREAEEAKAEASEARAGGGRQHATTRPREARQAKTRLDQVMARQATTGHVEELSHDHNHGPNAQSHRQDAKEGQQAQTRRGG